MDAMFQMGMAALSNLATLVAAIVTGVAGWILAVRMRRRIKRTLGINPESEAELTSLNTWINVEDTEERNRGSQAF
jgi:hypothetical protein